MRRCQDSVRCDLLSEKEDANGRKRGEEERGERGGEERGRKGTDDEEVEGVPSELVE